MAPTRKRTPVGLKNNSRDLSIISAALSRLYHEHIEIQNLNSSWFDQVEDEHNPLFSETNVGESNISNGPVTSNNPKGK